MRPGFSDLRLPPFAVLLLVSGAAVVLALWSVVVLVGGRGYRVPWSEVVRDSWTEGISCRDWIRFPAGRFRLPRHWVWTMEANVTSPSPTA